MANKNSKPYFLLVFEKGDTMPTIISAEIISEIYPNAYDKTMNIITVNEMAMIWTSRTSSLSKWFLLRK